ncbi:hypothetical protein GCM10020220_093130 [Nonomuraea rubra]
MTCSIREAAIRSMGTFARREQRAGGAGAVVRHGELAADARLPQEQPRARAFGHAHVLDVHALAPQDGQGSGAQLVIGHLAQVRAAVPEPGQGDGQRELRAADVQSGLALVAHPAAGDDPQRLAQRVDVRHGPDCSRSRQPKTDFSA